MEVVQAENGILRRKLQSKTEGMIIDGGLGSIIKKIVDKTKTAISNSIEFGLIAAYAAMHNAI